MGPTSVCQTTNDTCIFYLCDLITKQLSKAECDKCKLRVKDENKYILITASFVGL
jgi:hypothetical protein